MLAEIALQSLDVSFAKRVYGSALKDIGMYLNLERIEAVEERSELIGHIAVLFNDFEQAYNCFINSSNKMEALHLTADLEQYDKAISLAEKMDPTKISVICMEYAFQLEMDGKIGECLQMFKKAIQTAKMTRGVTQNEFDKNMNDCQAGFLRASLKHGEIVQGMQALQYVKDTKLILECATILENMNQLKEAAIVLERAHVWDKAFEIWLKCTTA
jgi:hypothetical protein